MVDMSSICQEIFNSCVPFIAGWWFKTIPQYEYMSHLNQSSLLYAWKQIVKNMKAQPNDHCLYSSHDHNYLLLLFCCPIVIASCTQEFQPIRPNGWDG